MKFAAFQKRIAENKLRAERASQCTGDDEHGEESAGPAGGSQSAPGTGTEDDRGYGLSADFRAMDGDP